MSSKRIKIPGRLESAETGNVVTGADAIMDDTRGKKQVVVNNELEVAILALGEGKQNKLTFDNTPTEDSTNPVTSGGVYSAEKILSDAIEAILLLIPSAASALNKLVDMQTMNSSIATATASFKGTYNLVSDLHLTVDATHAQIEAALDALSLDADNNDYCFVQVPNTDTAPTEIKKTERYKFNGTNWAYEYDLNNSGFTSAQWNAINSGITTLLVSKLDALPTNSELVQALAAKQDNLTFDNAPVAGSNNPVTSGGIYTRNAEIVGLINALDQAKQDVLTFDNTPTEGSSNPVKSGGVYLAISAVQATIVALDAAKQDKLTFDTTPTLGSTNPVTSSGIKTELNRIDGAIVTLDNLYRALTQSSLVVVAPTDTWPVANPDAYTIYRVIDRVNTPPQYYSDYMFSGSTPVLMAQYDNAIDAEPTLESHNLVESNGVFLSMKHSKQINIQEDAALSGWQPLERPVSGLVYITANSNLNLAPITEKAKFGFIYQGAENLNGVFVYLEKEYVYYNNNLEVNNFKASIRCVDIEEIFGGIVSPSYCQNWQRGYYNPNGEFVIANDWKTCVIDVEVGKTYIVPYTGGGGAIPINNLDADGNFVCSNGLSDNVSPLDSMFKVVKAVTPKMAITLYLRINTIGTDITISDLLKLPYICLTDNRVCTPYKLIDSTKREFVVKKAGGGDYTSLTKAIMDNFGRWGVTIYLEEGEYDLFQELQEYYRTSDFISLTPSGRGIELGYDITIKGSPKALVKAIYQGNDERYYSQFSAFNCFNKPNTGGYSLIGVNIHCVKIRYCVHDEKGQSGTGSYVNVYEGCNFYLDNSQNVWNSPQCIGGGLGKSGTIIIRNCMFEGITVGNYYAVTYHNNRNVDAKSQIYCSGNYIKGDYGFQFYRYGDSIEKTTVMLSDNNVGRATDTHYSGEDQWPDNMEVIEWNNIIRS